jgi:hypothetical protein
MDKFDYDGAAELFTARSNKQFRPHSVGYRRFGRAVDAIRFAIEELPADLLSGAYLEVDEERFDRHGIRHLYESREYPLQRNLGKPKTQ